MSRKPKPYCASRLFRRTSLSGGDVVSLQFRSRSSQCHHFTALAERDLEDLVTIEPRSVEAATAYGYLDKGVYPTFLLSWYADFFDADNYVKPFLECQEGSPESGCRLGETQYHGSFFYDSQVMNSYRLNVKPPIPRCAIAY